MIVGYVMKTASSTALGTKKAPRLLDRADAGNYAVPCAHIFSKLLCRVLGQMIELANSKKPVGLFDFVAVALRGEDISARPCELLLPVCNFHALPDIFLSGLIPYPWTAASLKKKN